MAELQIEVPKISQWDHNIDIRIKGLIPNQPAEVVLTALDEAGVTWRSAGTYIPPETGEISTAANPSVAGTYLGIQEMGLFWSMQAQGSSHTFYKKTADPLVCRMEVKQLDRSSQLHIERHIISDRVRRVEMDEEGVIGTWFQPKGLGKVPAVLVLGGSDGGLDETMAGLLSNYGYAALALPYLRYKDLPVKLRNLPLEYFYKAIQWLGQQEGVDNTKIGVFGRSKGGELALLMASQFPEVRYVISHVGGGIIYQGIGLKAASSWTMGGRAVAYAPLSLHRPSVMWNILKNKVQGKPVSFLSLYEQAMDRLEPNHGSIIPVEKINGPILLTSGTDDGVWPSARMNEWIMNRLEVKEFAHDYRHLALDGAGHDLRPPYYPTTGRGSSRIWYGGGTVADFEASRTFWRELLDFLSEATASPASKPLQNA